MESLEVSRLGGHPRVYISADPDGPNIQLTGSNGRSLLALEADPRASLVVFSDEEMRQRLILGFGDLGFSQKPAKPFIMFVDEDGTAITLPDDLLPLIKEQVNN